jgi:hypothetical protein
VCPSGVDVTLQLNDHWFFTPGDALHPLSDLVSYYHQSVGSNGHLEIDFAIDRTGGIAPKHAAVGAFSVSLRTLVLALALSSLSLSRLLSSKTFFFFFFFFFNDDDDLAYVATRPIKALETGYDLATAPPISWPKGSSLGGQRRSRLS